MEQYQVRVQRSYLFCPGKLCSASLLGTAVEVTCPVVHTLSNATGDSKRWCGQRAGRRMCPFGVGKAVLLFRSSPGSECSAVGLRGAVSLLPSW